MIKEVIYSGYAARPADYECPDGQLAASLNLICEDGHLKPILPPKKILTLATPNERILLTHSVPGQENYIILREASDNKSSLWWLLKDPDVANTSSAEYIDTYDDFKDIAIVGNTIVIASEEGVKYALWKNNTYVALQDRPPFIVIDFGTYKIGTLSNADTFDIPARCGASWSSEQGQAEEGELAAFTQMAYGLLLSKVVKDVTSLGYFYMPFFVRYAYRLYDGTYSWHSSPILMLPTILPPIIKYSDDGSNPTADETLKATLQLKVPYFGLTYRVLSNGLEELADWSDLVTGIDVFISAPIYTYDQSKDLPWRPVTDTRSILGDVTNDYGPTVAGRPGVTLAEEVFVGHYAESIDGKYIDRTMRTSAIDNPDYHLCLNIQPHPDFHRNIEGVHTFYKVAELETKNLTAMTGMARLKLSNDDLSTLVARPTLTDDYQSHCQIAAGSLFAFNSRLNLAGVKISPAKPFPMRSMMQFGNPDGTIPNVVRITVWTRINGVTCHAVYTGESSVASNIWFYPAGNFPRYIFYPDSSAYKIEFYISETERYIVNLKPHDFLNGAYWYCGKKGMRKESIPSESVEAESTDSPTSVNVGAKVYTSEVNNPFFFPATGIVTVGNGQIVGLAAATQALSQGQFGQFPLYAFATDGVWALEVSASGSFGSRHPASRDVCVNHDSITQIDSAVLFASDRGIMMLQGSNVVCISESIDAIAPTSLLDIPMGDKITKLAGLNTSDVDVISFQDFLKGCRMLYDYPKQRIIVYNPEETYAYVYSLRSQSWGMIQSSICDAPASYPEPLAITSEKLHTGLHKNYLVDFSQSDATDATGILLSRPLKLDAPDILKTVDTVIQRGNFAKGHVSSALYGSRDLVTWFPVWSSKDHYLRGFRGSPYKYFRIAGVATLDREESIFGATVQFEARKTNQLR